MTMRLGTVIAGLAAAFALTACSGSNVKDGPATSTLAAAAATPISGGPTAGTGLPPVPTAAELDTRIRGVLDRGLPDEERLALIEEGESFRADAPDLWKAMDENPGAKYGVKDPVEDNGDGTLNATFWLQKDGSVASERNFQVQFVALDGTWKVRKGDVCAILQIADYPSQACI